MQARALSRVYYLKELRGTILHMFVESAYASILGVS